jgi:hypothetical protein
MGCQLRRWKTSKGAGVGRQADSVVQAELLQLLDREAIRTVVARYCRGWDRRDRDLVQSCYWPEATDDHGLYRGPASDFFDASMRAEQHTLHSVIHHHLGQSLIELDRPRATAETYCLATMVDAARPDEVVLLTVRYVDRFEVRDGEWRIRDRHVLYDSRAVVPGGVAEFVPSANIGHRDRSDVSYDLLRTSSG